MYILIRCKTRNRRHARTASSRGDGHTPALIWAALHPWATTPRTTSGRTTTATPSPTTRTTFTPWATTHRTTPRAHTLERFRASDGRALAPSGMPHALSRAPSVPSRAPSPRYVLGILPRKVVTTSRHKATLQGGGCPFSFEVCSKSQFALTVKKLTRFLGFDLRIAVFWKFSFCDIYLEQINIKTLIFSALKQSKLY